jgi:nucleotide-binding universal stress UspA family protein
MIYSTIMVQLNVDGSSTDRIEFAWELANRFEADLIGFAACDVRPVIPATDGVVVDGEIMRYQIEEIENRLKALRKEFEEKTRDSNRATWREFVGNPTRLLAQQARVADLIVAGAAGNGIAADYYRTVDIGTLILSAGRPILFASESLAPLKADNVVVAWKDTREARRAVADAMPFLVHARDVLVVTLEEADLREAQDSVTDVVRFLMKHGVRARSDVVAIGGRHDGEALAEIAHGVGADMVVAGGFGHSRLREWAFGGVTRSLLRDRSLNRLISN